MVFVQLLYAPLGTWWYCWPQRPGGQRWTWQARSEGSRAPGHISRRTFSSVSCRKRTGSWSPAPEMLAETGNKMTVNSWPVSRSRWDFFRGKPSICDRACRVTYRLKGNRVRGVQFRRALVSLEAVPGMDINRRYETKVRPSNVQCGMVPLTVSLFPIKKRRTLPKKSMRRM